LISREKNHARRTGKMGTAPTDHLGQGSTGRKCSAGLQNINDEWLRRDEKEMPEGRQVCSAMQAARFDIEFPAVLIKRP
jgi:hypothetical protein